ALETALWCRYCLDTDENGQELLLEDESAEILKSWAVSVFAPGSETYDWPDAFGQLASDPEFIKAFDEAVRSIATRGVSATLTSYIDGNAEHTPAGQLPNVGT
ncbi:MAG: hypothetical protein K5905_27700, partial [Roseibium sp.]|nr:hypothetical protein [Roseibium sp.]